MAPTPAPLIDLTRDLRELARAASADDGLDELLRRGLDWLGRLAPYDLAAVFELHGERLVLRAARGPLAGPSGPKLRGHALELARFPSIREALETRRARTFTESDHAHGDGDPFDGVLDLPHGHACMVVPLVAGDRAFGVLSLDRARCEAYAPGVVELAEVYGQLLALALVAAEQRASLARLASQEREHAENLEAAVSGADEGVLAESRSPAVRELARRARQVAATPAPVLILGETGTGKERLARAVHAHSPRAGRAFVTLNCAAVPATLLESELFGHVRGAFTGATRDRAGRFQLANGGTLLLDEIGELPVDLQAKLLRVLQEGELQPVGSDRTVRVDVRVIAATHVDLRRAMDEGRFREDLYYRLAVFPLHLPPLRERLEDLPLLCETLLAELGRRTGRRGLRVTEAGLARLAAYPWPGNVRELGNVLERAAILASSDSLGPDVLDVEPAPRHAPPARDTGSMRGAAGRHAPAGPRGLERAGAPEVGAAGARGAGLGPAGDGAAPGERYPTLDDVVRAHLRATLARTGGRIYGPGGAAELLGVPPSTLQSRMKKLGVARRPGAA
jgi:transcriptional regulator with GAF, ATPase, and Fis domain